MDEVAITALLEKLSLHKGAKPMEVRQRRSRIEAYTRSVWPWAAREQHPDNYEAWRVAMVPAIEEAQAVVDGTAEAVASFTA